MPKAVFWNLGGSRKGPISLEALLRTERPDLAAFGEIRQAERPRSAGYETVPCRARLHLLRKVGTSAVLLDDGRLEGYAVLNDGNGTTIAFCHFMSSLNGGRVVRVAEMRALASRLRRIAYPWRRIVVLGDLNCDPFDEDLRLYDHLNAKQTYEEARIPLRYREEFHPMLVALGHAHLGIREDLDGLEFVGSFKYRNAGRGELSWRLLDHALVSADLKGASMRIVDALGGQSLVPQLGTPEENREFPDHLPIVVEW